MKDKEYSSNKYPGSLKKDLMDKNIQLWKEEIEDLSYEDSIEILESILVKMQDENISLDNIQNNYIKGNILLQHCQDMLDNVEQEIIDLDLDKLNLD